MVQHCSSRLFTTAIALYRLLGDPARSLARDLAARASLARRSFPAGPPGRLLSSGRRPGKRRGEPLRPGLRSPRGGTASRPAFFPAFLAGMTLVVLADDAFTFLLSWEFMSLSSWALVMAHHRDRDNAHAGYVYLVMASFGTLACFWRSACWQGPRAATISRRSGWPNSRHWSPPWCSGWFCSAPVRRLAWFLCTSGCRSLILPHRATFRR
jgi:hypothetical protein